MALSPRMKLGNTNDGSFRCSISNFENTSALTEKLRFRFLSSTFSFSGNVFREGYMGHDVLEGLRSGVSLDSDR